MRLIHVMLLFAVTLCVVSVPSIVFAQDAIATSDFWSFLGEAAPGWVVIGLIVLRQVAEIAAKAIPDTATGGLATLRRIFKILSLYIPNKK